MSITIQSLAGELFDAFEKRQRDNGESFYTLREGSPAWMLESVRAAHGDFLPDDWRYEAIQDVAGAIHDYGHDLDREALEEVAGEVCDSRVDVYNADRLKWVASNLARAEYVNDAVAELGLNDREFDLFALLGQGQYMEYREIFDSLLSSLADRAEELAAESESEDSETES